MTFLLLFALAAVAGLAGTVQGALGIGFSLLVAPVAVLTLGVEGGIWLVNVTALAINVSVLRRDWRSTRWGDLGPLLVALPVGVLAARVLRSLADPRLVLFLIGVILVVTSVHLARPTPTRVPVGSRTARLAAVGASCGAFNLLAGVGGPALGLFYTRDDIDPRAFRATVQWPFALANLCTIPLLAHAGVDVGNAGMVVAAAVAGSQIGGRARSLPQWFRPGLLVLAFVGGALCILRALLAQ